MITRDLEELTAAARDAHAGFRLGRPDARATLLSGIAAAMRERGEEIVEVARRESHLAEVRIRGELERTARQLEMFACIATDGDFHDAVIDLPDPDAQPIPRPDLRRARLARGPVAVFGAGNFPLAFGVAGGDTASALATGSPVISKSHSGHTGTDELVATVIDEVIAEVGLPAGTHSLLHTGHDGAGDLVRAPEVTAVAFTGSTAAGLTLAAHAADRDAPIPVFAEMGSSNPAVVTPGAAAERPDEVASLLAGGIINSAGQLCTKPGLVLVPAGSAGAAFADALVAQVAAADAGPLLSAGISERYDGSVAEMNAIPELTPLSDEVRERPDGDATPHLWSTDVGSATSIDRIREEVFGPAAVLIAYRETDELLHFLGGTEGQLSASIFSQDSETELRQSLVARLMPICGRIVFDAPTTGVAVCMAQQHGGPYPATLDDSYTSVGGRATDRFVRPVAFQDCPDRFLPEVLRNENPLGIMRLVDGVRTQDPIIGG